MKRNTVFCLILPLLVFTNTAFATFKSDSLYIRPFPKKLSMRTFVGIKEFSIEISNSSNLRSSNPRVNYKPNNGLIGGIGLSYRNLLISYYFKIPNTELNKRLYGNTSIYDYQLNVTTRFLYLSGFYRTYRGFYASSPSDNYPNWSEGLPLPQRPDIYYTTEGIESIVNLNPEKYSLNASLKLTEQQFRSAFATLIYANYSLTSVRADSSIVPSQLRSSFFNGRELFQTNFSGWSVMPGISYVLAKGRWFVNPMIFTGLGYSRKEMHFKNDGTEIYHDYYIRINFRLNYGYNAKSFFGGVFIEWNEMFLPEEDFIIRTENFNAVMMVGFRF